MSLNDDLFKIININEFKRIANIKLKNISIALTPRVEIISNETQQKTLIKQYHDDPITGGHTGRKRLIGKLKNIFGSTCQGT